MAEVKKLEGYCRITIGTGRENRRCVEAIRSFFERHISESGPAGGS